jgi:hypothetical protein
VTKRRTSLADQVPIAAQEGLQYLLKTGVRLRSYLKTPCLTTQLTLQKTINKGLEGALLEEQKRRKRGKNVFEELRAEDGCGATFFSPSKMRRAMDLQLDKDEAKAVEKRQKEAGKQAKMV